MPKWSLILRTPAVWALIVAYFTQAWGSHTLMTVLPSYLKFAFDFDMRDVSKHCDLFSYL